jgi:hypothetical protein
VSEDKALTKQRVSLERHTQWLEAELVELRAKASGGAYTPPPSLLAEFDRAVRQQRATLRLFDVAEVELRTRGRVSEKTASRLVAGIADAQRVASDLMAKLMRDIADSERPN